MDNYYFIIIKKSGNAVIRLLVFKLRDFFIIKNKGDIIMKLKKLLATGLAAIMVMGLLDAVVQKAQVQVHHQMLQVLLQKLKNYNKSKMLEY